MSIGFNSKLQLGDRVYDVQTEDHGVARPFIDTVVLLSGQVLYRRSASYSDLLVNSGSSSANTAALRAHAERQHSDVLESLRSGSLALQEAASGDAAIEVRLQNPSTWLIDGNVTLEIEVRTRANGKPVVGAGVEAGVEGAEGAPERFSGETDASGRVRLEFAFPRLSDAASAALVISARASRAHDQLRYNLKPAMSAPPAR